MTANNYEGLRLYLADKMDRPLLQNEAGSIVSFNQLPASLYDEGRVLAGISAAYATVYVRYLFSPHLAKYSSSFVEQVLIRNLEVDEWVEKFGIEE